VAALAIAGLPHLPLAGAAADVSAVIVALAPVVASMVAAARARPGTRVLLPLLVASLLGLVAVGVAGLQPWLVPLQAGCLVAAGYAVGSIVGARVQFAGHMLPAAAVAAAADVASVLSPEGPSNAALSSEKALSVLALAGPVPGTHAFTFVLGVGDLVFVALALRVAVEHGASLRRVTLGVAAGLVVAFASSALSGVAIPALVPLGIAVVVATPEFRRVRKRERTLTAVSVAASIAVIGGVLVRAALAAR
jgi:hypothetical protein